jgi:hypothetical protein
LIKPAMERGVGKFSSRSSSRRTGTAALLTSTIGEVPLNDHGIRHGRDGELVIERDRWRLSQPATRDAAAAKTAACTATSYTPDGNCTNRYVPSALVGEVCAPPINDGASIVTVAPCTTAPLPSRTVPVIEELNGRLSGERRCQTSH